jgi:Ca2+-binding RTX toxin-like protein
MSASNWLDFKGLNSMNLVLPTNRPFTATIGNDSFRADRGPLLGLENHPLRSASCPATGPFGDQRFGDRGNDRLVGNAGFDRLNGGKGNDILIDYYGGDRLTGGKGKEQVKRYHNPIRDAVLSAVSFGSSAPSAVSASVPIAIDRS